MSFYQKPILIFLCCLLFNVFQTSVLQAQDSLAQKKLTITGDFRFRIEHDWHSRRPNGTFRDDRSRLRFRNRFGATYQYNKWASFGLRIRTGNLNDQQGPHLTLGGNGGEFSTLQIGLEKAYFKAKHKGLSGWLGKNTFPFEKQNELFWNDNVFPEGAFVKWNFPIASNWINSVTIGASHFIITANNQTFGKDNYFQGIQFVTEHWGSRLKLFPAFYYFNQVPTIPDGKSTNLVTYGILHLGGTLKVLQQPNLVFGIDYYNNFEGKSITDENQKEWINQHEGIVLGLKLGDLKKRGDWLAHLYYAHLKKYAVVDYFAQNDWARWDYSGQGATGSRLTNFQGVELRLGYAFGKNFNLILRAYSVEQLIAEGQFLESGNRIRLDLDIGF
ncbi:MAG: hypothetical protein DHS20C18_27590 [Saprospiraceae bacterium]|nr:MAG: hypothetical protein DHS20C18_27590 [Saprospiraceae bacterium]